MTTRRSSSQRVALIDSQGQAVTLQGQIGKGGEGSVFEIAERSDIVAKIYHKAVLDEDVTSKLDAMMACRSEDLASIAAWPESVLFDKNSGQARGFLMARMKNARPLHELYGTASRRVRFPDVRWHHLLLAARNLAAAFDTMHSAGIVVGDVNQGNLLVDNQMRVRLIDCDSFQVTANGRTFHCPVGTPHFTPTELQSVKLRDVVRTVDHDGFGLAVLIFHLVFVGRHPFAGRFRGQGDLTIERAIAERRFAFSSDRKSTLVDPPPASLKLSDLTPRLGELFEAAFRGGAPEGDLPDAPRRPTPLDWATELEVLMKNRAVCSFDQSHVNYNRNPECPWCRIEDEGGPAFFLPDTGMSLITKDRMGELDRRIRQLRVIEFPELPPKRLEPSAKLALKALKDRPQLTKLDYAALGMEIGAAACLAGVFFHGALAAGPIMCLAGGAYMLFSERGKEARRQETEMIASINTLKQRLLKMGSVIRAKHNKRAKEYQDLIEQLRTTMSWYQAEGEKLQEVLKQHRSTQRSEYLRQHLICDHVQNIPGLTGSTVAMLESYNVETALQIDSLMLAGIPNVGSGIVLELMQWRGELERNFKFQPDHGVTEQHLKEAEEAATQRFKTVQARKILMGSKQLDALAEIGKKELAYELSQFDALAAKLYSAAKELRDFLSGRRNPERFLNRSPIVLSLLTVGIPLVSCLLAFLFR
ncbi:MAG: hypothetical protein KDA44_01180 [Planctomycetales bacterium]|nr:hypothetical protein [Planctomycetales bacterium]